MAKVTVCHRPHVLLGTTHVHSLLNLKAKPTIVRCLQVSLDLLVLTYTFVVHLCAGAFLVSIYGLWIFDSTTIFQRHHHLKRSCVLIQTADLVDDIFGLRPAKQKKG